MTLTVTTAHDVGHTGTWCTSGPYALVQLPAHHVTPTGAQALQVVWRAAVAADAVRRAGPGAVITYDRCRAATRVVRLTVVPGRVVGTLAWDHFTAHGAAAVQAVAWAIHQDLANAPAV